MRKIIAIFSLIMAVVLTACGQTSTGNTAGTKEFTAICRDEEEKPVSDVTLQVCTDKSCMQVRTEQDGKVTFDKEEGMKVTLTDVPDGYSMPEANEITIGADDAEYTFLVEKKDENSDLSMAHNQVFGTQVSALEDIPFSDYKLVLVNFWEPWCGYCIQEMPALEELYQKYKDEGFLIVGMYSDEDGAQDVLDQTKVTYPIIKHDGTNKYIRSGAYPTSIFFNSKGEPLPQTEDELYTYYETTITGMIEKYQNGDYDGYTDDASMETKNLLEELAGDKDTLESYCRALAENDMSTLEKAEFPEAIAGAADYDTWEARIKARLGD